MDPDARVNIQGLRLNVDFYASQGLVQGKVVVAKIVANPSWRLLLGLFTP